MDENCKRQKEVEKTFGGLLPAVEGHSLGTRYNLDLDLPRYLQQEVISMQKMTKTTHPPNEIVMTEQGVGLSLLPFKNSGS